MRVRKYTRLKISQESAIQKAVRVSSRIVAQSHPAISASFSMTSEDDSESEYKLIEDACNYVTNKIYPDGVDKNRKRIIRRKARKIVVKQGEVYYKKKKTEVCIYVLTYIAS